MPRDNRPERENVSTRESDRSYESESGSRHHLLDSSYGKPGDEVPRHGSMSMNNSALDRSAGDNCKQQFLDIPSLWNGGNGKFDLGRRDSDRNFKDGKSDSSMPGSNNSQDSESELSKIECNNFKDGKSDSSKAGFKKSGDSESELSKLECNNFKDSKPDSSMPGSKNRGDSESDLSNTELKNLRDGESDLSNSGSGNLRNSQSEMSDSNPRGFDRATANAQNADSSVRRSAQQENFNESRFSRQSFESPAADGFDASEWSDSGSEVNSHEFTSEAATQSFTRSGSRDPHRSERGRSERSEEQQEDGRTGRNVLEEGESFRAAQDDFNADEGRSGDRSARGRGSEQRNVERAGNEQNSAREFASRLEQAAKQTASELGTVGYCAKGVRMALNTMGFNIRPGRDATDLGRYLAGTGKFDKVPLSQMDGNPPPGSIVVRNWNDDVIRQNGGRNIGDIAVMGQNGMQYNDHAQRFQPDGGRYRNSYVLIPKGYYGGASGGAQSQEGSERGGMGSEAIDESDRNSRESSRGGGSNGERIWRFLRNDLNLTSAQAAGVIGNLQQESRLDPTLRQYGGGPGFGLAQWEGPRKRELQQFARQQGRSAGDLDTQLQFMKHELNTTERSAMRSLRSATTVEEAALAFNNKYERAGRPHMANRYRYARQAYEKYAR